MITASRHLGKALLLLMASSLFVQCQKDEPSTEAKVETTIALFSNAAMQGKLTINESYLAIERMDVEANSTTGSQVVLSSPNPNPDTRINLTGSGETPFNYDLTQGKYDPLTFAMYLRSDAYELKMLEGTSTPDFADFLQNSTPSMVFSGTFSNRGQVVRVFISLDLPNRLLFSGTQLGQTLVGVGK